MIGEMSILTVHCLCLQRHLIYNKTPYVSRYTIPRTIPLNVQGKLNMYGSIKFFRDAKLLNFESKLIKLQPGRNTFARLSKHKVNEKTSKALQKII